MSDKENEDLQNKEVDEAFGELLANFVQKHSCFYNKKCKEYKDKKFVGDTWSSIANACNMPVDFVQKQWKSLRCQFTREHRLEKIYEPSGTGNDTAKRPRKTWYLYNALFFLAPHVTHRRTSNNFVRKSTITQSSPSTSSQSASQSEPESSRSNLWFTNLFSDNLNALASPERSPERTSSESLISAFSLNKPKSTIARRELLTPPPDQYATRSIKESRKEQEYLSKIIGNTTDSINSLMNKLSQKHDSVDNGEKAAIAKVLICALRKVNSKYKMQCYMECISLLNKYQNLSEETVQNP